VKLRCIFSGHEVPPKKDDILKYVNGKAFKKYKLWYSQDFAKYEPLIIQSTKHPKKLYCTITKLEINKIPSVVENHINGKKFKSMLQRKNHRDEKKKELDGKRKLKDEQNEYFVELNEIIEDNMDDNGESSQENNEKDFNVNDTNVESTNDNGARIDDYVEFTSKNKNLESEETMEDNFQTKKKKSLKRKKIVGPNEVNIPPVKKKKIK